MYQIFGSGTGIIALRNQITEPDYCSAQI